MTADDNDTADEFQTGFYCRHCGQVIDGDEPGYPRSCGCEGD